MEESGVTCNLSVNVAISRTSSLTMGFIIWQMSETSFLKHEF